MRALSLCSGIGALDLAMQTIGVQTIAYCEYDPWCGEVLQHRMASGHLDSAPIWRDLKTLDGYGLPAGVDLIYGGIPCQPHSTAGGRAGADDPRDLWPATRRLLGEVRPRLFFLENVAGFATRNGEQPAFAYSVLADLAALGYVGRAGIVKASDAGAPHSRARWFCLAALVNADSERPVYGQDDQHAAEIGIKTFGDVSPGKRDVADARLEYPEQVLTETTEGSSLRQQGRVLSITGWAQAYDRYPSTSGALDNDSLADARHDRGSEQRQQQGERAEVLDGSGVALDESKGQGREEQRRSSGEESAHTRPGLPGQFPPHRLSNEWSRVPIEWHPAIESNLRGVVDGHTVELDENRRKRLAALGNAVVPAQVLLALTHLLGGTHE